MEWLRFLIYFELYLLIILNYRVNFENVIIYKCNNLILVIVELVIVLCKYIVIIFINSTY